MLCSEKQCLNSFYGLLTEILVQNKEKIATCIWISVIVAIIIFVEFHRCCFKESLQSLKVYTGIVSDI